MNQQKALQMCQECPENECPVKKGEAELEEGVIRASFCDYYGFPEDE